MFAKIVIRKSVSFPLVFQTKSATLTIQLLRKIFHSYAGFALPWLQFYFFSENIEFQNCKTVHHVNKNIYLKVPFCLS